jgi:hypothetical protein
MVKAVYWKQSYEVGSRKGKSRAIILPSELVRLFEINQHTLMEIRPSNKGNQRMLTMRIINSKNDLDIGMPANENLASPCEQASALETQ